MEVMAALVVLGLILVALTSGVHFGQQAVRSQVRATEVANQIEPVDRTLRSLIAQAWPGSFGQETRFVGAARTLLFRTTMPEGLLASNAATAVGLRNRDAEVSIGVDSTHHLYLAWLPWYRNWIVAKPPANRIELLANVDHVEFAYWDPSLQLPPDGWVTAWIGDPVPKLLRVRLIFTKGTGERWPDIIVAIARQRLEF